MLWTKRTLFVLLGILAVVAVAGLGIAVGQNSIPKKYLLDNASETLPTTDSSLDTQPIVLAKTPPPIQAVIQLSRTGTISVRTNGEAKSEAEQYSREDVQVFDTKLNRVDAKELPRLLKEQQLALAYMNGQQPNLLDLRLVKDGTLIVVLPKVEQPMPGKGDNKINTQDPPLTPATQARIAELVSLDRLRGEWVATAVLWDGQPCKENINTCRVKWEDKPVSDSRPVLRFEGVKGGFAFEIKPIDANAKPKQAQLRPKGEFERVRLAIYEINGDNLKIYCFANSDSYPKDFTSARDKGEYFEFRRTSK